MNRLRRHWFLVGLLVLISLGLVLGSRLPAEDVARLGKALGPRANSLLVALVLFLMSFSLDSLKLGRALKKPGPVLLACAINYGLLPVLAWFLMPIQLLDDFSLGLMIAATVPSTMAAASVWTRKAGGNDAVSLLVTMLTNGLCFIFTPLWLQLLTSVTIEFDVWAMVRRLVYSALLPCLAGQMLRFIPSFRRIANDYRTALGVIAQSSILVIVFSAAFLKAGPELNQLSNATTGPWAFVVVALSCISLHVAALTIGWHAGRALGFVREDRIGIAFAGSQKTLPVGLLVATMFGGFTVFPMLFYHASQLFIDTWVAEQMAAGNAAEAATFGHDQ